MLPEVDSVIFFLPKRKKTSDLCGLTRSKCQAPSGTIYGAPSRSKVRNDFTWTLLLLHFPADWFSHCLLSRSFYLRLSGPAEPESFVAGHSECSRQKVNKPAYLDNTKKKCKRFIFYIMVGVVSPNSVIPFPTISSWKKGNASGP